MGWPTVREDYGHGVVVVVVGVTTHQGTRESCVQGKARQIVGVAGAMRDARCGKPEWPYRSEGLMAGDVTRKRSRVVLRGAVGKAPTEVTRWPPTLLHARFCEGARGWFPRSTHPLLVCCKSARPALAAFESIAKRMDLTLNWDKTRETRL